MTDRVGQQLGNYRLVRVLGQGGQASVYLGEHLHLKSHAAIKVLRTELRELDVAKFLAEGQTLARLTHTQIVRINDFAVEQGTPFLVMDYASKGALRQHYPRGTCLSLDTVVTYVKQIASALQYAHNRNVIQHMSAANFETSAEHAIDRLVDDFTGVLGPHPQLQGNGGPTQTFALLSDSQNPVLDMIPFSACQMKEIYDTDLRMYVDERRMPRPGKNKQACDSGAYEYQR